MSTDLTISIGAFARLSGVGVKTLRHYDQLGVLRAASIDERTGYRRYEVRQRSVLHRARALAAAGLPLQRVARLMNSPLHDDPEMVANALRAARAELQSHLTRTRAQLAWIEAEIDALAGGGLGSVFVKSQPAIDAIARRAALSDHWGAVSLLEELVAIAPDSAMAERPLIGTIWHACGSAGPPSMIECEAFIALTPHASAVARLEARCRDALTTLPATTVVSHLHRGDVGSRAGAWTALSVRAEQEGYKAAGPPRELYVSAMVGDTDSELTELQLPVTR